jgi:hypothetical protein
VSPEALLPLAAVVIVYVAAYAGDMGRAFHPLRGMGWGDALRLAGLPEWRPTRTERDLMPLALPIGAVVAVYGDLFPPAGWEGPVLELSAGAIAAMGLLALLGPPAPARRPTALSYPRRSRLRIRHGDVRPVSLPAGAPDADAGRRGTSSTRTASSCSTSRRGTRARTPGRRASRRLLPELPRARGRGAPAPVRLAAGGVGARP